MSDADNMLTLTRRLEANEIAAWRAALLEPCRAVAAVQPCRGLSMFEPATDALLDALLARARDEKSHRLVHVSPGRAG